MGKIALSMITHNSLTTVGRDVLNEVLRASLQVPYDLIILIDDGNDGTRKIISEFADEHGKELIIEGSRLYGGVPRPTRATARQTAIDVFLEGASHDYLLFLDDDVVLNPGWWVEFTEKAASPNWGIAWGVEYPLDCGGGCRDGRVRAFLTRGGEHDTVHPRHVLREIRDAYGRVPPWLHAYEDAWLFYATRCLGYGYLIIETGARHYQARRLYSGGVIESVRGAIAMKRLEHRLAATYGIVVAELGADQPTPRKVAKLIMGLASLPVQVKRFGLRVGLARYMFRVWFWASALTKKLTPPNPCAAIALNKY